MLRRGALTGKRFPWPHLEVLAEPGENVQFREQCGREQGHSSMLMPDPAHCGLPFLVLLHPEIAVVLPQTSTSITPQSKITGKRIRAHKQSNLELPSTHELFKS